MITRIKCIFKVGQAAIVGRCAQKFTICLSTMSRELITPEGLRLDGRRAYEIRKLVLTAEDSNITADAACYYQQGNNKILVKIIGPRQSKDNINLNSTQPNSVTTTTSANTNINSSAAEKSLVVSSLLAEGLLPCAIHCDIQFNAFSSTSVAIASATANKTDRRAVEYSSIIKATFEGNILTHLYPDCEINIMIEILSNDGSILSSAINATEAALQLAGIAQKDTIAAATVGLIDNNYLLDIASFERVANIPEMLLVHSINRDEILTLQCEGKLTINHIESMINLAKFGCKSVNQYIKEEIKQFSLKLLNKRGMINT
jgi:exosome complex component RRP41